MITTTAAHVTSRDGTAYGFHRIGSGPGVVLIHGATETGASHSELAEALATQFTVYLPDRRGRGRTGPFGTDYTIDKDVQDLEALLRETGTQNVFGLSSGALILLKALVTLPGIRKAVLYEPPLVDESYPSAFMGRFDQQLARGDLAGAMITGMKGGRMGPPLLNSMPGWLLRPMVTMAMNAEARKAGPDDFTMRRIAPTLSRDFQLVREMTGTVERYRDVSAEVLLLGGSRSPRYLKDGLDALESVLPHVTRTELAGLGHDSSGNADKGGKPEVVAPELLRFFGGR